MRRGDVVAGRYEIERLAGAGGMGRVYQARDRATGDDVALKLLPMPAASEAERFMREARVLEALRHPGIVRYVGHGATESGALYLAMEWLEGETLSERLSRGRLTIGETLTLGARIAASLAAVHKRRIVHRDLKPSNLFLAGSTIEGVTLIDFGIARVVAADWTLTEPGALMGTPGYVAPEQARGAEGVDARADVFSLGCVLYRCLTGAAAFEGEDRLSVLLKVMIEEPPRIRALNADVPRELEDLVTRMISKVPSDRPRDGEAVGREIAGVDRARGSDRPSAPPATRGILGALMQKAEPRDDDGDRSSRLSAVTPGAALTAAEQRAICLVLARDPLGPDDATLGRDEDRAEQRAITAIVEHAGGTVELCADRSIFAVFTSTREDAATDLAARAAGAALALHRALAGAPIALVSGRGEPSSKIPVGKLIERAVLMLNEPKPRSGVLVDGPSIALLGSRFAIAEEDGAAVLTGARDDALPLAKRSRCVGRERELSTLEASFARASEERAATAVLVVGPAGAGKTRLMTELSARLAQTSDAPAIWIGHGDPLARGAPLSTLGRALRSALGITEGEPVASRWAKITERLAGAEDGDRIACFLAEIIGAAEPVADDAPEQGPALAGPAAAMLRAARRDAVLMADQMLRAFEDFTAQACASRPVMLVLDDLQWGDLSTIRFVDAALRTLRDEPLFVLALARPEVHEVFPRLWAGRALVTIALGELSRRSSEILARSLLPSGTSDEVVRAIVERGAGNAFLLEELARASAQSTTSALAELPETVIAMVESRLLGLDPEARRVLRAASILGRTFTRGAVTSLVGGFSSDEALTTLLVAEVIAERPGSRVAGDVEYELCQEVVREAAYGMLTERDRRLGHELAARWLVDAGEPNAAVIAEHFERGGAPEKAVVYYRRAAEQALGSDDLDAALALVARGIAAAEQTGAEAAEDLGALHGVAATARALRGENAIAEREGSLAMRLLPRARARWCSAAGTVLQASGKLGLIDQVVALTEELLAFDLDAIPEQSLTSYAIAVVQPSFYLLFSGRRELAEALFTRATQAGERSRGEPAIMAEIHRSRAAWVLVQGDVGSYLRHIEAAREYLRETGNRRGICTLDVNVGYAHMQLGAYAEAEIALRGAITKAERIGLYNAVPYAKHNLGLVLARLGRFDEAKRFEAEALAAFRDAGDKRMEIACRIYAAVIAGAEGDHAASVMGAGAVASDLTAPAPLRIAAFAALAEARLGRGETALALTAAREGMSLLASAKELEEGDAKMRLVHAEALYAAGDRREAIARIVEAKEKLLVRAAEVSEPKLRESFLGRVPENARTLARALEWSA